VNDSEERPNGARANASVVGASALVSNGFDGDGLFICIHPVHFPGSGADRQGDAFTLGTGFTVITDGNVVTALGIYDVGGAFTIDHMIALWDHTAGDTLVASATFLASSTNAGTPAGFLYVSISPLLLVNGDNYILGAFYPGTL
jgi:hypothetical protein